MDVDDYMHVVEELAKSPGISDFHVIEQADELRVHVSLRNGRKRCFAARILPDLQGKGEIGSTFRRHLAAIQDLGVSNAFAH